MAVKDRAVNKFAAIFFYYMYNFTYFSHNNSKAKHSKIWYPCIQEKQEYYLEIWNWRKNNEGYRDY